MIFTLTQPSDTRGGSGKFSYLCHGTDEVRQLPRRGVQASSFSGQELLQSLSYAVQSGKLQPATPEAMGREKPVSCPYGIIFTATQLTRSSMP